MMVIIVIGSNPTAAASTLAAASSDCRLIVSIFLLLLNFLNDRPCYCKQCQHGADTCICLRWVDETLFDQCSAIHREKVADEKCDNFHLSALSREVPACRGVPGGCPKESSSGTADWTYSESGGDRLVTAATKPKELSHIA